MSETKARSAQFFIYMWNRHCEEKVVTPLDAALHINSFYIEWGSAPVRLEPFFSFLSHRRPDKYENDLRSSFFRLIFTCVNNRGYKKDFGEALLPSEARSLAQELLKNPVLNVTLLTSTRTIPGTSGSSTMVEFFSSDEELSTLLIGERAKISQYGLHQFFYAHPSFWREVNLQHWFKEVVFCKNFIDLDVEDFIGRVGTALTNNEFDEVYLKNQVTKQEKSVITDIMINYQPPKITVKKRFSFRREKSKETLGPSVESLLLGIFVPIDWLHIDKISLGNEYFIQPYMRPGLRDILEKTPEKWKSYLRLNFVFHLHHLKKHQKAWIQYSSGRPEEMFTVLLALLVYMDDLQLYSEMISFLGTLFPKKIFLAYFFLMNQNDEVKTAEVTMSLSKTAREVSGGKLNRIEFFESKPQFTFYIHPQYIANKTQAKHFFLVRNKLKK